MRKKFPFYEQLDTMDCGPSCLRMIARFYGKNYELQSLRDRSFITREGVSLLGISEAAECIGFKTLGVRVPFAKLVADAPLPCIVHWKQNHFVVVYDIGRARRKRQGACVTVSVADPSHGLVKYSQEEFLSGWLSTRRENEDNGFALLLEPSADFYEMEGKEFRGCTVTCS